MADEVLKKVMEKEEEMKTLHTRMDGDKDLYFLKKYTMLDRYNAVVDGIINVTLNLPATFAAHVQSALMGAIQQAVVSGDDMEVKDTTKVENALDAVFRAADARLRAMGEPMLRPFAAEQVNIRGQVASRTTLRVENNILIPDIIPVDTRFFSHEMGVKGMEWGAYRTTRSLAMAKSEYGDIRGVTAKFPSVVDYWDGVMNRVYVEEILVDEQENPYGYPPFPYQVVPLGSMLKDKDTLAKKGESIFFLIRDLIPELNRLVSLLQTSNQEAVQSALTWHTPEGIGAKVPTELQEPGSVTAAPVGGGAERVPTGDINAAGKLMHSILTKLIEAASLSLTSYGNLTFPLSAVALIELSESSNQVFLPRLGAIGLFYQQMAEMIVNQVQKWGIPIKAGTKGHQQTYPVSSFKGAYDIEYKYTIKSPTTDAALYQMAEAASMWYDTDTILGEILKVPNPADIREKKRMEDAEQLVPELMLYNMALAFIEQGEDERAKILADKLNLTIEQIQAGEMKPSTNGRQPARNLGTPVLEGTPAGSSTRARQLMGEAEEPVGAEG